MPIPETAETPYEVQPLNLATVQGKRVMQAAATPVFHLVHYPDNWEVGKVRMEDGSLVAHWLPEMSAVPVVPGVCMCRTIKAGEPPESAYQDHLAWLRSRGQIPIPMDAIIGGSSGYVRNVTCQNPHTKRMGLRHFDAWSTPKVTKKGKTPKFLRDEAGFNSWRLALVQHGWTLPDGTSGRIPNPDPDVIAAALGLAHKHLERKESDTDLPDRAYARELGKRKKIVEELTGAVVPSFIGAPIQHTQPDYSAVVIKMLVARIEAGEGLASVLADVPDADERIAAAVTAAATPTPKPKSRK